MYLRNNHLIKLSNLAPYCKVREKYVASASCCLDWAVLATLLAVLSILEIDSIELEDRIFKSRCVCYYEQDEGCLVISKLGVTIRLISISARGFLSLSRFETKCDAEISGFVSIYYATGLLWTFS